MYCSNECSSPYLVLWSNLQPITHPPIGTKSKAESHLFYLKSAIHHLPSPFLRKYAESMLENPSRFMVVYLRDHCCRCGCVIEGLAKRCDTCKQRGIPFVLCTQCYPVCYLMKDFQIFSFPFLSKHLSFTRFHSSTNLPMLSSLYIDCSA